MADQLLPRLNKISVGLISLQLNDVDVALARKLIRQADAAMKAVAVPRHSTVDALVLVAKVLVQISVQDRVEARVRGAKKVEEAVDDLLVAGHAQKFEAGLPELRHQLEDVERQPGEEEDASHRDDDVVDAATSLIRIL